MRQLGGVLLFLVLLIPSAWFAWSNRDMPQFGRWMHDDSVYFVCARSLAQGAGYRILSLPEQPYQTKYPPLYPLLLSWVWRARPVFPGNLYAVTALGWVMLPILLLLVRRWYQSIGVSELQIFILVAVTALNPYFILFSASMLSEMLFSCLLLACLLLYQRASTDARAALAAGVAGSLAYLTRTAGLALLVPAVALLLWRRRWKHAALFSVPVAAAVVGWTLWTRAHRSLSSDVLTIYYTDYLRYQIMNVAWRDLPLYVWRNLDVLLKGMGALVLPDVTGSFFVKALTQTIAVGMIAGVVRLLRRPGAALYGWFCLFYSAMLLIWHFPPNERFVLPMFPLLLAGLGTELVRLWAALRAGLRHAQLSQRIAAVAIGATGAAILGGALLVQCYVAGVFMPGDMREQRARRAADEEAFRWISVNLPAPARLLAYDDPLVYLYTGRPAACLTALSLYWYRNDHAGMVAAYSGVVPFARQHALDYAYVADSDYHRHMGAEDASQAVRVIRRNPDLEALYRTAGATVYRIQRVHK